MQQIRIDFDNPGLPQSLGVVEGESQSRIFQAALYKSGAAYTAPAGAVYSIMYRGFGPQNQGWYDTIEDGAGKRAACTVSSNVVTCELARQALRVPGHLTVVLCVSDAKGYMLKSWPIMADVRNDGYEDTGEIEMYFNLSGLAGNYLTQLEKAMADAEATKNNLISTSTQVQKDIDAKAAETLKTIPESYTELDGNVKRLKEDLDDISIRVYDAENENIKYPLNVYNPDELSVETRVNVQGKTESNADVSTTGYIRATKGDTVYTFRTYVKDTSLSPLTPTYISEFDWNKKFIKRTAQYPTNGNAGQYDITDGNVKFIRIENPKGVYTQYFYSVRINYKGDNTYTPYSSPVYIAQENNAKLKDVKKLIKVMSYNVGKFSYGVGGGYTDTDTLPEKIITTKRFFGKMGADIIGLQEKKNGFDENNTIDSNTEIFDYLYPNVASRDTTTLAWDVDEIRSKYKISDYGYNKFSTDRVYVYGTINVYGVNIYLINVHLDPFSAENRNTERTELLTLLQDKKYFILTGDFNALSGVDEFKAFKNANYNVANSGYFGNFQTTTINGQCIDNIITSPNIKIENVYVPNEAYEMCSSDHYPIIADLIIN